MTKSKLKTLLFVALSLTFLLSPLAIDLTAAGKVYAMGGGGGKGSSNPAVSTQRIQTNYVMNEENGGKHPNPVPEPATMLLVGAGLGAFAIFRKKFKK